MSRHTVRAYIGLGANVGDATATLPAAVGALADLPGAGSGRVAPVRHRAGRRHRSARVSQRGRRPRCPGGPDPAQGALALLAALKALERESGRQVRERWGPRELDLDLLIFGRGRITVERPPEARSNDADADPAKATKLLVVPHPEARQRLFVLAPLSDVARWLAPPGWGETVDTARRRQEAIEGPDAVRPIGRWDGANARWVAP